MSEFLGSQREIIGWLLGPDNPSVRYFTLTEILRRPDQHPEVREARAEIMTAGIVPKILAKQDPAGFWMDRRNFYLKTKYKGTVWQINLLADLMADGRDSRIQAACEFLMAHAQNEESGGFAYKSSTAGDGDKNTIIPCLTGNMAWSLIRLGYGADPRTKKAIDWIVRYQRFDDAEAAAPQGWPYRLEPCWGRHTCMLGVVKALKALSEIPPAKRSAAVKSKIRKAIDFILQHRIFMRSHNPNMIAKASWLCLGFPLFWDTDILEMIWLLVKNSVEDSRMNDAVELIFSKQDRDGRWELEKTFNGRMLANIEAKGKASKWITARAWQALRHYDARATDQPRPGEVSRYADEKK